MSSLNENAANSFKVGAIDFAAGSLGGVALVYVSQPLDTVKVKMQTFPHLYGGMVDCLAQTFRKDGFVRGLYAGTMPAVVANVAENSVLFAAYGACQSLMVNLEGKREIAQLSPLSNATAGFLAAFFSSFTLCPTELIKCQLQALREVQTGGNGGGAVTGALLAGGNGSHGGVQRISAFQLTRQILRDHGVRGMYRGMTSTLMREMPGYFFFFGGYEATRELLRADGQSKDDIGLLKTMTAGSVGGLVLWTVIFPADVIKSRIQVNSLNASMLAVGTDIVRKEGPLALYNGLKPTLIRTIPATACLFVVYEYSKKFMAQLFDV